jgi:HEPN domain-containing protein
MLYYTRLTPVCTFVKKVSKRLRCLPAGEAGVDTRNNSDCEGYICMTPQNIIQYWQDSAQDDLESADILFQSKKYSQCLFYCHLATEKLIKGLIYVKKDEPPLPIHNLLKLFSYTGLSLPEDISIKLREISKWNIEARYDSVKREFFQKATIIFTQEWLKVTHEVYLWLKNQY